MIVRIVQLTFKEEFVSEFLNNFEKSKKQIRHFEGCLHLTLLQDKENANTFFTISKWESQEHLESYRNSELFTRIWSKTKPLFASRPKAWSTSIVSGGIS